MPSLHVNYTESSYGGGVAPGQENVSFPDYEDTFYQQHFAGATRSQNPAYREGQYVEVSQEVFESPGCYLALVRYSDGDSFSESHGNLYLEGAYLTAEEAYEALSVVEARTDSCVPWNGCFASKGDSSVVALRINDE